jgi:hypothetical protein
MKATIYPLLVAYTAFAAAKSVEKASSQKKKKKKLDGGGSKIITECV